MIKQYFGIPQLLSNTGYSTKVLAHDYISFAPISENKYVMTYLGSQEFSFLRLLNRRRYH